MYNELELNCCVVGTELYRAFPVKIQSSESVGTLKKEIQKERKDHSPADTLILWKVSNRAVLTLIFVPLCS
jgi:Crinkler effector protein N-terminal domain